MLIIRSAGRIGIGCPCFRPLFGYWLLVFYVSYGTNRSEFLIF
ncbi:hypothetical protein BCE_0246 [Bacillus cereus ATCC 10987]|uniref:Uncharacterized protein n=1 Tax=Bacillus cereus (strain ATCC 10987 / NRS 248) TaxID=222523 RepID=Q73EW2_BACC1|nr:hypothetical protein BCE_0246 [Bacillus cereus ATCC 10987]